MEMCVYDSASSQWCGLHKGPSDASGDARTNVPGIAGLGVTSQCDTDIWLPGVPQEASLLPRECSPRIGAGVMQCLSGMSFRHAPIVRRFFAASREKLREMPGASRCDRGQPRGSAAPS